MPTTEDYKETSRGAFVLAKGESGSGKSGGALSFPGPYVFDFDKKMPGIALKHFRGKKIDWDTFPDIFKVTDKIAELTAYCPYETVIADSITHLVNLTLSSLADVKGERVMDLLRTLTPTKGGKTQVELMGIDYYNAEDRFITFFLDQMKALWDRPGNPKHVIITAHVMTVESAPDLKTKIVTRARSIVTKGRKVAAYIPTPFDEMWHFGTSPPDLGGDDKVRHLVTTQAVGEDNAKTAYNLPTLIDFTGKSLYDEICKYVTFA